MIFLLFILSAFSGVTDNCNSANCTMKLTFNGIESGSFTGLSADIKAKALIDSENFVVEVENATTDELDKKTKKDKIYIDIKGQLESGSNLNSADLREILLHLLNN